jgi:tetratricopeptide (TPR) repeat protein
VENGSIRDKVVALLKEARAAEHKFIEELDDAERALAGQPDRWASKDIISHMTFWQECQAHRMEAAISGKTPDSFDDFNQLNEENFDAHRNDDWHQVRDRLDKAFDRMIAATQKLSDPDLTDGTRFPWTDGRPLIRSVIGNGYSHPVQHYCEYYISHGQRERAIQAQEAMAEKIAILGDEGLRGDTIYNLACFYALSGQPKKALELLPEALRLSPALVEWSKQDTDLVSLREEPAFKALHIT